MYTIFLRNDKTRFYDRFAVLTFLLNGIGLFTTIFYAGPGYVTGDYKKFWLAAAAILTVLPLIALCRKEKKQFGQRILAYSLAAAMFWIYIGYWWIGVLFITLVLLYLQSKKELAVSIQAKKIVYPSFPQRKIDWDKLNNLVLKDRLLTIDFKNNKLIQQQIDPKSYSINEPEFNDFCKRQIRLASA